MGAKKLTIEAVHSLIEPLKSGQERLEKRLEEVIQHLTNDRDELLKRVERLEENNKLLKERNQLLERNQVRNELLISGIPAGNNFTAENVITQTAKAIGVHLVFDNEIDYCFKTKNIRSSPNSNESTSNKRKTSIVVRFIRNHKMREFIHAYGRKGKKEKGLKLFGSNIYLNEAVTSDVREILREARKLREAKKIAAVWTWRGKLFIRLDQENKDERIHIPSLCDLHRICDAAAGCETVIDSNT